MSTAHHGVVTLPMAVECGVHARTLRRRAAEEGWPRIARGAWLLPGAPDSHRARAMAHQLLLGDRALVSHDSAAYLHDLLADAPRLPVLTVPADRRPDGRPGVQVHRSRTLIRADLVTQGPLRVTSVDRTLRDIAAGRSWPQVYDQVTDAEQRRMTTLAALVATAERLGHGPGAAVFGSVVRQRQQDRSDSALERDGSEVVRAAGYRPWPGPFPARVLVALVLHLDIGFPDIWFAFECDGFGFHRNRRAFELDRRRWRLAQRAGWRLGWITRRRLRDDPDGIIEELADAYRTADPNRAPALPAT